MIDTDGTGVISRSELEDIMSKVEGLELEEGELDQIMNEIDYEMNGTINYSEFMAATLPVEKFVTEQQLKALFDQFDGDGDQCITADNLSAAFIKFGWSTTSKEEIETIMAEHDLDHNLSISYKEFIAIIHEKDR